MPKNKSTNYHCVFWQSMKSVLQKKWPKPFGLLYSYLFPLHPRSAVSFAPAKHQPFRLSTGTDDWALHSHSSLQPHTNIRPLCAQIFKLRSDRIIYFLWGYAGTLESAPDSKTLRNESCVAQPTPSFHFEIVLLRLRASIKTPCFAASRGCSVIALFLAK